MKGLEKVPSIEDLGGAYDSLLGTTSDEASLALWTQWVRFDPRLGEILVAYLSSHWKKIDLFRFRESLLTHPWPQAFGVIAENALAAKLVHGKDRIFFKKWIELVLAGIDPAPGELFFFGLRKLGGKEALADATHSSKAYSKWGYFGRDLLVNKAASISHPSTQLSPEIRKRLLEALMNSRDRLTPKDYREALSNRVSIRQAELDLQREKRLSPVGNTRARFYRVRPLRKKPG